MAKPTALLSLPLAAFLCACGVSRQPPHNVAVRKPAVHASAVHASAVHASAKPARLRKADPPLQALVTAQTANRLLVVGIRSGRAIRSVSIPGDPAYVDATPHAVVVVSSDPGKVTLLDRRSMRVVRVFRGLSSPHIPAISPDRRYAYITDDGSGKLIVINLADDELTARVFVGAGAHHLAFSPDEHHVWVALGQAAQTLTILSTVTRSGTIDLAHPHVVSHFTPPFLAHDLLFSPNGKELWITAANTSYVGVFSAATHRLLARVPVGAPPQHLAFAGGDAYLTSGYGSSIERVDLRTQGIISRAFAPHGSFDLDAGAGYVVTASLFEGTLAVYDRALRLLHVRQLAPSTEDVALSRP